MLMLTQVLRIDTGSAIKGSKRSPGRPPGVQDGLVLRDTAPVSQDRTCTLGFLVNHGWFTLHKSYTGSQCHKQKVAVSDYL